MIEINLLPWRDSLKRRERTQQMVELVLALLLASLVLLGLHFILLSQLRALTDRITQAQTGLAKVNKNLETLRSLYQAVDYQTLPDFDLKLIWDRQRHILDFLRRLTELLPREVYVRQIHFEEQAWVIEGVSLVLADILLFSERLKRNEKANLKEGLERPPQKEKFLNIKQKNELFYYQLRLEGRL